MLKQYTLSLNYLRWVGDKNEYDQLHHRLMVEKFEDLKISVKAQTTLEAHTKARKEFQDIIDTELQADYKSKYYNFILKVVMIEE